MKTYSLLFIFFILTGVVFAQTVSFSFPVLPEKAIKAYYFRGDKTDSLQIQLDGNGSGKAIFPENHAGFVQAVVNDISLVEFIVGENNFQIRSEALQPSNQNITFSESEENDFFSSILDKKRKNRQKSSWLKAGAEIYKEDKELNEVLERRRTQNENEKRTIDKEIAASSLYAARFLQIIDFVDELYQAVNKQDASQLKQVKTYLQTEMDWSALYTSGQGWTMVHANMLKLFRNENPNPSSRETQQAYAGFVSPLMEKTNEPVRSAMLKSILDECESLGWETAKEAIVSYIITNNVIIDTSHSAIARLMQAHKAGAGETAPEISGIDNLRNSLVVFHELGCGSCDTEMELLKKNYSHLQSVGIRIISISGKMDQVAFKNMAESFPWQDKLCDCSEEVNGSHFENYGIAGTPTFILIDKDGIIQGRYARLSDVVM